MEMQPCKTRLVDVEPEHHSSPATKRASTFTLNTKSTNHWHNHQWTEPLNLMVQQMVKIGKLPVALTVGGRYCADKPADGPGWGLRFAVIFLFPK